MKVDTQLHGSVSVVVPRGPLAGEDVAPFLNALAQAIELKSGRVVVDMGDVTYLDSGGIEALLSLCGGAQAASARPRLAKLGETSREALDLTNVLEKLTIFDTVESAIRSYKR